jgi:FkbH-like protein
VVAGVSYEDKFGPLGIIGVIAGHLVGSELHVTAWVLSCRAFSRRIEHHMLAWLFSRPEITAVQLDYRPTTRNGPLQDFLKTLGVDLGSATNVSLQRQDLEVRLQNLPHRVAIA